MNSHLLTIIVGLSLASPLHAQLARLLPVDEAIRDTTLIEFRSELLRASDSNDTTFLRAHLAPDVRGSFGGDPGPDDFMHYWFTSNEGTEFWNSLKKALRLGGSFDRGSHFAEDVFIAPYYFSEFDKTHLEIPEVGLYGIVLGKAVPAHVRPHPSSSILARLSYDVVSLPHYDSLTTVPVSGWVEVRLKNDRTAFVQSKDMGFLEDFRIGMARRNSHWFIVFAVAGD